MQYEAFLRSIDRWARIGSDDEERAARATLETLTERLDDGEARLIARHLPDEFYGSLYKVGGPEPFDVDEFLRRVAAREGVDLPTAERHVRAVFAALRHALPPERRDHLAAALPEAIRTIFCGVPNMPAGEFVLHVAVRADLTPVQAVRAAHAALDVLARRIAPGEVVDLISLLPVELHEPLKRGRRRADALTRHMSVDEFVSCVAALEEAPVDQARRHAQAVFATLREAVGDEYFDGTVELPPEYFAVGAYALMSEGRNVTHSLLRARIRSRLGGAPRPLRW